MKLNNQEIRNCIYNGTFNTLLKKLAKTDVSKKLFGVKSRFSVEEMILRFFAFHDSLATYTGKLSVFLNDYMFENRNLSVEEVDIKTEIYNSTAEFIHQEIFDSQPVTPLSKSFLEGLLYGVSQNLPALLQKNTIQIKELYNAFKNLPEFSFDNLKE